MSRSDFFVLFSIIVLFSSFAWGQVQGIDPQSRQERDAAAQVSTAAVPDRVLLPGGTFNLKRLPAPAQLQQGSLVVLQLLPGTTVEDWGQVVAGYRVLGFIDDYTYWARSVDTESPGAVVAVAQPPGLLKTGRLLQEYVAARSAESSLPVYIIKTPDASPEAFAEELSLIGVDISRASADADGMRASVPGADIRRIAESNLVLTVEFDGLKRIPHNRDARGVVNAGYANNTLGLYGRGVNVGVWDGGPIAAGHKEFGNRVTNMQGGTVNEHATHVAGTIGASGRNGSAEGMASGINIFLWDFDGNVIAEMLNARAGNSIYLSNHSWGFVMGWSYNGWYLEGWGPIMSWYGNALFGTYTQLSNQLDTLSYKKDMVTVFSAGNDRGDSIFDFYYYDELQQKLVERFIDDQDGPYMTVGPTSSAKNVISVGAVNDRSSMSDFSSWGPTRDGRLKPEICAPGVDIFSTAPGDGYQQMSGTSMAAPVVTGCLALLMESWRDIHGKYPKPAVVRAIIVATAQEIKKQGPEFNYGYGVLDIGYAAQLSEWTKDYNVVIEDKVTRGKVVTYTLTFNQDVSEYRVALAWSDPPGSSLVNDLDLRVIAPGGKTLLPLTPNPSKAKKKAKPGRNTRDNIEVVYINNARAGEQYIIEIEASRLGKGGRQKFAMAVASF